MADSGVCGIEEANPPGDPTAIVKYSCATADRYQLIRDLVGSSTANGTSIFRTYPYRYPPSPNLIVRSIESVKQIGAPRLLGFGPQWLGREKTIVTVRFGPPIFYDSGAYDASGMPYTTTTFQVSSEIITAPQSTYKFSGGLPTNTPVGIKIPLMQISMKRHMLPYVPLAQMAALTGYVNVAPLNFLTYSFATGTVLFLGGNVTLAFDNLGNLLYEAEYLMSWRYQPWNNFLHPNGTSGWQPVADGNGNPPFPSGDFSTLP